jgi:hypothetical protein
MAEDQTVAVFQLLGVCFALTEAAQSSIRITRNPAVPTEKSERRDEWVERVKTRKITIEFG